MSQQQILTTVMMRIIVNNSTENTKPHSICLLPQYQCERKCFSRVRAEKGIARHINVSSVAWTGINNGKLANQIVRLVAIVVKLFFSSSFFLD